MKSKWAIYKELELIPDDVANPNALWPMISAWLRHTLKIVVESVTSRATLQIWKKTDGIGHTWWYVYDPATHRTHYFASEREVRVWLEARYYSTEVARSVYGDNRIWH
jgi:hypothetical protein